VRLAALVIVLAACSDPDPCAPVRDCLSQAYAELNACCPSTPMCNAAFYRGPEPPPENDTTIICSAACTFTESVVGDPAAYHVDTQRNWTATDGTLCGTNDIEAGHFARSETTHTASHTIVIDDDLMTNTTTVSCDGITVATACSPSALDLGTPSYNFYSCATPEPGCMLPGLDH
jgi:hypothetical protein